MKIHKKNRKLHTLSSLLKYIKHYKYLFLLSLIFATISALLMLYLPVLVGRTVDGIIDKSQVDFALVSQMIRDMVVVVFVASISQWLMSLCNNQITYKVVRDLRKDAFEHIQNLPISYLDGHSNGNLLSRVTQDADAVGEGLLLGFSQFFIGIVTIIGTLVFMISINFGIALVVIGITPLSLIVASFIAKHTFFMFQKQSQTRGEQTGWVEEVLENQKVVAAFSQEEEVVEKFEQINQQLAEYSLKAIFYSSLSNPCTRFINGLVYTSVGVIGAIVSMGGGISIGQLVSFLSYANQYTKPFNEISAVVTELSNALACGGRLLEIIEEEPEKEIVKERVNPSDIKGQVSIEKISFSYEPHKPFIKDLTLHVQPGQKIAIVGPTGCGKTTFINLLMRFYEIEQGSIRIDGSDISDWSREQLRSCCGMVLQDTWLKTGTILENISLGKPEATKEEIIQAAKKSYADRFIRKLPLGYDTLIKEDGGSLSAGQKQLLCITRLMLMLPPILILDEATSSIDVRTEQQIQKAFGELMRSRTSFVVAHRLSTIQEADLILYMQEGTIVEQGNHKELLQKKGKYHHLYYSQFAKQIESR